MVFNLRLLRKLIVFWQFSCFAHNTCNTFRYFCYCNNFHKKNLLKSIISKFFVYLRWSGAFKLIFCGLLLSHFWQIKSTKNVMCYLTSCSDRKFLNTNFSNWLLSHILFFKGFQKNEGLNEMSCLFHLNEEISLVHWYRGGKTR